MLIRCYCHSSHWLFKCVQISVVVVFFNVYVNVSFEDTVACSIIRALRLHVLPSQSIRGVNSQSTASSQLVFKKRISRRRHTNKIRFRCFIFEELAKSFNNILQTFRLPPGRYESSWILLCLVVKISEGGKIKCFWAHLLSWVTHASVQ